MVLGNRLLEVPVEADLKRLPVLHSDPAKSGQSYLQLQQQQQQQEDHEEPPRQHPEQQLPQQEDAVPKHFVAGSSQPENHDLSPDHLMGRFSPGWADIRRDSIGQGFSVSNHL